MHPIPAALAIVTTALLLSACASTEFKSTWSEPDAKPVQFKRTLAVFMSADEATRRAAETRLVELIGPQRSAPSYSLLSTAELKDVEAAKEKVRAAGFDGAVVMRITGEREQVEYRPPVHYQRYWGGYHYRTWNEVNDPGYLATYRLVSVETNVYSLTENKLIWSGLSDTFDPSDTSRMVGEVATAAAAEMRKQGLLPPKP